MHGEPSGPLGSGVFSGPPARDLRRAESQAIGHSIGGASVPPRTSPSGAFLTATKDELGSAIKNLVDLNGRLGALANRVFGSQPETSSQPIGAASESGGAATEIEHAINVIHLLVQSAHFTVARLESL